MKRLVPFGGSEEVAPVVRASVGVAAFVSDSECECDAGGNAMWDVMISSSEIGAKRPAGGATLLLESFGPAELHGALESKSRAVGSVERCSAAQVTEATALEKKTRARPSTVAVWNHLVGWEWRSGAERACARLERFEDLLELVFLEAIDDRASRQTQALGDFRIVVAELGQGETQ